MPVLFYFRSSIIFISLFKIMLEFFSIFVFYISDFRGKPLRRTVWGKDQLSLFFRRKIFMGIFFKFSVTCFCNYFSWTFILAFWLNCGIYRRAHNVFETLELVSFLAKFIDGSSELSKALVMACFNISWSLRCGAFFRAFSDVWDGAFCENS